MLYNKYIPYKYANHNQVIKKYLTILGKLNVSLFDIFLNFIPSSPFLYIHHFCVCVCVCLTFLLTNFFFYFITLFNLIQLKLIISHFAFFVNSIIFYNNNKFLQKVISLLKIKLKSFAYFILFLVYSIHFIKDFSTPNSYQPGLRKRMTFHLVKI